MAPTQPVPLAAWLPAAQYVLRDVLRERAAQVARYGLNDDLDFGTGPGVAWLAPLSLEPAAEVQRRFRQFYEDYEEDTGKPTWSLLIREELAETLEVPDTDLETLRAEAIQTAALLVSMCAQIDARLGITPTQF
jgi:hypothetical protein